MGNAFYRIKIGLYVFVIVLVGALFAVRTYNALQKTVYLTPAIFDNGDVRISLSYPAKILSPKNETSYPLTISFIRLRDLSKSYAYEIVFESPTLLFVDAKGAEITPRFQITSEHALLEQNVYVRPFQSEMYLASHVIFIKILVDGREYLSQPDPIEIKTEPKWFSYLSLIAASLLEISIASALVAWIATALDTTWNARKELISQKRNDLNSLASLPLLERMRKFRDLENKIGDEYLDGDLSNAFQQMRNSFSEREVLQAVGDALGKDRLNELSQIKELHKYFFTGQKDFEEHNASISALAKIIDSSSIEKQDAVPLISAIVKLWDDFDADVKDLIVGALERFSEKVILSEMPSTDLIKEVFNNGERRRMLDMDEIGEIFHQVKNEPLPPRYYDARWLSLEESPNDPQALIWLKQHSLMFNPFGYDNLALQSIFPKGILTPVLWESFLRPVSLSATSPTAEDSKALAFLLRNACLPTLKVSPTLQVFPIWVSLEQKFVGQSSLSTIIHCAVQTWLDILPLCPDALLDLSLMDQQTLLEMLCWSVGSKNVLANLLKQYGLKEGMADHLLLRKISEFECHFTFTFQPQDFVLLSWLKIRPLGIKNTYLILTGDEPHTPFSSGWFNEFGHLMSPLWINGIVTKVISSDSSPISLHLPKIKLSWTEERLQYSLNGQFVAAMDPEEKLMGKDVRFLELFGPGSTEEETTKKLISASHHSLARMLTLGNRLFQQHCEQEVPEKYLTFEELDAILKTA